MAVPLRGPIRRLKKELQDVVELGAQAQFSVSPFGHDLMHWKAFLSGPPDTPYQGGVFMLSIRFPPEYPTKPPHVVFLSRVYHPNIADSGFISLDILQSEWSPTMTMVSVMMAITSLLSDPTPTAEPLQPDVAMMFNTDRELFTKLAQEWTRKYARPREVSKAKPKAQSEYP